MTKLEYLTCSNDCYFDTNYYPTTATSVYFKYSFLSDDTGGQYGGIVANNGGDENGVQSYVHNNCIEFGFCGNQTIVGNLDLRDVVECEFDRDSLTFNGTSYSITSGSNLTNNPFYINCLLSGNWSLGGNYYRVKFYEGNTLAMDLVPCIDNNNTVCFYDEVGQSYIYPSGSGTPTAGPVATNVNYVELDYLSTTGATWFELDHRFTTGEKIDVENATISHSGVFFSHQQLIAGGGGEWVRIAMAEEGLYSSYYGDNKISGNPIILDISESHLLLENGEFYVDDVLYTTGGPYTTGVTQSTNMVVFANTNGGSDAVSNQTASIGRITIYGSDDSIVAQYIPCLDSGNTVCFYNPISDTYIYKSANCGGTPIAGPVSHLLTVEPNLLSFQPSGGTSSFTVNCQTGWTCTTPTNFSLSTTSGTSGETIVSVTAPNYTGATAINETVTITDDDGYTKNVVLKQKKYSTGGLYNCFLGDTEGTFYLGGLEVSNMYLGEVEVYSKGEFVGFKMSASSTLEFESGDTKTISIKSTEPWTLQVDSSATWLNVSTLSGDTGKTQIVLTNMEDNKTITPKSTVITGLTANYSGTCVVTQSELVQSGCVKAVYVTTAANETIAVVTNNGISNYSSMKVDGALLESVVNNYTFANAGRHYVIFTVNGTELNRNTLASSNYLVGFYVGEGTKSFKQDLVSSEPNLKEVYFPSTITGTGRANLYYCTNVERILGPTAIDNLYWGIGTDLWCVACAGVGTNAVIPTGFTAVKEYAFASYNSISSYTFHSGVTSVAGNAMDSNTGGKELVFYGTTPPSFSSRNIGSNGTMYVPYGCTAAYAASDWGYLVTSYGWTIQEMNP